jgi:hypothetical protein
MRKSMLFFSLASMMRVLGCTNRSISEPSMRLPVVQIFLLTPKIAFLECGGYNNPSALREISDRLGDPSGIGNPGYCHCPDLVDVDHNKGHLICLGGLCTQRYKAHLVVNKDSSELRVITSAGQHCTLQPVGLQIRKRKPNRMEKGAGEMNILQLSVALDARILISLFTADTDGKLCQQTRPNSLSPASIFSHSLSKIRVIYVSAGCSGVLQRCKTC